MVCWERCNVHHVTRAGQRKKLSPWRESNPRPLKRRVGPRALSLSCGEIYTGRKLRFLFFPRSWHDEHCIFLFLLPNLKCTIYLYLSSMVSCYRYFCQRTHELFWVVKPFTNYSNMLAKKGSHVAFPVILDTDELWWTFERHGTVITCVT